jgi:DNA segregation ATPase FtsK/SpoIIIE-like protein
VAERPRELAPGRLACGSTETGEPMMLDFDTHPHYLRCGATGSGNTKHVLWHT